MGKYSSVDVSSLQNTVTTALNELSVYDFDTANEMINDKYSLDSLPVFYISNAINRMTNSSQLNGSYLVLKKELDNLQNAIVYIRQYQNTELEIARLEKQKYTSVYNSQTKSYETRINPYIVSLINQKKSLLVTYEKKADSYLRS